MSKIYNIGNGELEELYNKNKARINSFLKKIIKLFSKGE